MRKAEAHLAGIDAQRSANFLMRVALTPIRVLQNAAVKVIDDPSGGMVRVDCGASI